ncbi:MAG TPA: hypothetical protein VGS62_07480 [Streptosporangiaceae bacterium]|nr:hypothetical protein [Streptosporangiaceae bacterium]
MSVVALITWFCTVGLGLTLLVIWLIEYDREFQRDAATRLPVPVISSHALLAVTGLAVWAAYLITDASGLALAAVVILGVVVLLGLVMAVRWIPVRRAVVAARTAARTGKSRGRREFTLPPERNFPLPLVVIHGLFAMVTIGLVVGSIFGGS